MLMAQRIQRPSSAPPSSNEAPGPPPDLAGRVDDARKAVASILKNTDWPKEASNDVQDLIREMEAPLALNKLPEEGAEAPEQLKSAIHQFLGHLESAQTRLKGESKKYGPKKKGFRKSFKVIFAQKDPTQCKEVVRGCRADIVGSSTTLKGLLDRLEAGNEQGLSRASRHDSNKLLGYHSTQPASVSNPTLNAHNDLTATTISSNSPPDQSSPQSNQVSGIKGGKQKGSSTRGGWLNSANKAFKLAEGAAGALPVVGSYVEAVAKVGLTVVEMVQTMEDKDETAERLGNHVWRLSNVLGRVSKHSKGSEKTQIIDGMNELQQELQLVQHQVKDLQAQRGLKKVWSSGDNAGSLKNLQEQVRAALEEIQLLANLNTSILVNELHNESVRNEQQRLLDRLGDGKYGARGNLAESVTCLAGTRVEILERIDEWIRNAESAEKVLWIRGMAGRGKSTIASTVALNWERRAACAIFHFRRGQNTLDTRMVCSLARQLGKSVDPDLRSAVLSSVRDNQDIADQRLDKQFNALFVTPLSAIEAKSFPILIIVDALDECDSTEYAVDFVKLIKSKSPSLPDNVKFLLTSRPEDSLIRALEPMRWRSESLDSGTEVDADIERFFHHGFARIRDDHGIPEPWPSSTTVTELVRMSQGLFQWARTVIKYLGERSPKTRLTKILGAPETWSGVDELYTQILSKALEKVDANASYRDLLLAVLGTLIATPYPLSLDVIAFLHADDEAVRGNSAEDVVGLLREEILADLNSLLLIPRSVAEPIRLMHTSIHDVLVDRGRCRERSYWVDLAQHHRRLAGVCMRQMNRHLRENICGLSDLSKPCSEYQDMVEREVSRGLQYCCRSWSIHLTESGPRLEADVVGPGLQEPVFTVFSEKKILYWLEVMTLIRCSNQAIMMARQVHRWLSQQVDEASWLNSLVMLWNDIQRFTAGFAEPIAFSPLHIYVSALTHCPVNTEIWKRYKSHAKVRTIRGVQPATWSYDIWARSVGAYVTSVAFLPDDTVIASGCGDGTIRLLDPNTGGEMREPLTGHNRGVKSVCFSPDGKLLASGSSDGTTRLWDPQTGSQVGEPLTGHSDTVMSVCFSPDGKLLASGSDDKTIRQWDPQTGSQVGEPLTGHSDSVMSVCFSPDGKVLASGSSDGTTRLWDPQTGSQVGESLTGHSKAVSSVCFSPDGRLLVSGSDDKTIRQWDPQTGSQVGEPLTGHRSLVLSICFSPDSKLLASGSADNTIRLWDPQTGSQVGEPLTGHSDMSWSVCFSPDGKLLASGSADETVRLWDLQTGSRAGESLTGHRDIIWSVCSSPDGKLLASGSSDGTIRLWDPQTGSQVAEPLTGHSHTVYSICFSPDGNLLASGSGDATIRLWDPQTGIQVGKPLTSPRHFVSSVCFSPDGKLLASGSLDCSIRLWSPETGRQVHPPFNHNNWTTSVWFSPDGQAIAVRDRSDQFRAWDLVTRQPCDIPPSIPRPTARNDQSHWVTFSSLPFFWLPSQYWAHPRGPFGCIVALCEGKLAVAYEDTISIFDISDALSLYNHPHL